VCGPSTREPRVPNGMSARCHRNELVRAMVGCVVGGRRVEEQLPAGDEPQLLDVGREVALLGEGGHLIGMGRSSCGKKAFY